MKGTFLTGLKLLNESVCNTCIAIFDAIRVSLYQSDEGQYLCELSGGVWGCFLFDSRDKAVAEGQDVF